MQAWEMELNGDSQILARLSEKFQNPDLTIACYNGEYFLRSTHFSALSDKAELHERANQVLQFLNGSMDLVSNRIDAIKSDGFWLAHDDGKREKDSSGMLSITMPLLVVNVADSSATPPYDWFTLWQSHQNVQYVFHLLGAGKLDWFSLFKIYETIRDDPQHEKKRHDRLEVLYSWLSQEQNNLFSKTANWYRHSDYGKYNEKSNKPPDNEISLSEANSFIRQLVYKWLTWKSRTNP